MQNTASVANIRLFSIAEYPDEEADSASATLGENFGPDVTDCGNFKLCMQHAAAEETNTRSVTSEREGVFRRCSGGGVFSMGDAHFSLGGYAVKPRSFCCKYKYSF